MKTNFKEYLKKKKAQNVIDKFATEYENKKIVIYGADLFAGDLFRNYDLSKLNIIGVADKTFQDNTEGNYYDYPKLSPDDLLGTDFDLLLIIAYDDTEIKRFLKKELFQGKSIKFKIKTLINLSLFEYIKSIVNGDL